MKKISSILIVTLFVLPAFSNLTAQTKSKSAKPFSVPCAKALQIGIEKIEALHDTEMRRRVKGSDEFNNFRAFLMFSSINK